MPRRHRSVAAEVAQIENDIIGLTPEHIKSIYGFEFLDTGKIRDTTYDKVFNTLTQWVVFNHEEDEDDDYNDTHSYGKFDDED